jgi:hypothetical protein
MRPTDFLPLAGPGIASVHDFLTGHPVWGTVNAVFCLVDIVTLGEATVFRGLGVSIGEAILRAEARDVGERAVESLATKEAAKTINLPAWRNVTVDMEHILPRHTPGGEFAGVPQTVFPSTMNEKGIERAIREAYQSSTKVGVQGTDRVLLRGEGRGLTIEMWFNKATRVIETAYPVTF